MWRRCKRTDCRRHKSHLTFPLGGSPPLPPLSSPSVCSLCGVQRRRRRRCRRRGGGSTAAQLRVFGIGNPETANRRRRINRGGRIEIPRGFEWVPGYHPEVSNIRAPGSCPSPLSLPLPGNFVAVRRFVHYPSFLAKSILPPPPFPPSSPPRSLSLPSLSDI